MERLLVGLAWGMTGVLGACAAALVVWLLWLVRWMLENMR